MQAAFIAFALSAAPADLSPAPVVIALERAWLDAYERGDASAMAPMLADTFQITFEDGTRHDKLQTLARLKPAPVGGSRFCTFDVKPLVHGDVVILSGLVLSEFTRDSVTTRELSRYTDTYVMTGGRWRVAASHLSRAAVGDRDPGRHCPPRATSS